MKFFNVYFLTIIALITRLLSLKNITVIDKV